MTVREMKCAEISSVMRSPNGKESMQFAFARMLRLGGVAGVFFFLSGCAYSLHQYSVSGYRSSNGEFKKGRVVTAEAEQFVLLSFQFDNSYADRALERLKKACPDGEIVGIHSRHSTSLSFLSYRNKIRLEGICLEEKG